MPRPILVTGATGFAGSHLIDLLAREPAPVVGMCRPRGTGSSSSETSRPNVTWRHLDILDCQAVREAIAELQPACVYHLAGWAPVGTSWRHSTPAYEMNLMGTHHVLEALREEKVEARVLVTGSAYVYGHSRDRLDEASAVHPNGPYAVSKLAQEMRALQAATDDGQAVIVTRSFNHLGPRQTPEFAGPSFARQIARIEKGLDEPVIRVGNLEATRDFTDVRDVVRAYRFLMDRGTPGTVYNVCSGRGRSMHELLDGLRAHARVSVGVETDPERLRPSDIPVLLGDPGRLASTTGWAPDIPFERTLTDLLDDWRGRA